MRMWTRFCSACWPLLERVKLLASCVMCQGPFEVRGVDTFVHEILSENVRRWCS